MTGGSLSCLCVLLLSAGVIPLLSLIGDVTAEDSPGSSRDVASPELDKLETPRVRKMHIERRAIEKGLGYLHEIASNSGQIGGDYPIASTALAGLAFLGAGHDFEAEPYSSTLKLCLNYILRNQDSRGFIQEAGGRNPQTLMHQHCFALLFLTQIYGELPPDLQRDVKSAVGNGIKCLIPAQSFLGGWDYDPSARLNRDEASITIGVLQCLRAARNAGFFVPSEMIERATSYVRKCHKPRTGGFVYSLSRQKNRDSFSLTAAAISTLQAAGLYDSRELRRGLDYLREILDRADWNPRRAVNEPFFFYGAFYASQVYFQRGGKDWADWYAGLRRTLLKDQGRDGEWTDVYGTELGTALAVLMLEIPYHYLPIFER